MSCAAAEPGAALAPKSAVHDAPCDTVCHPLSPLPPPAPALASPRAPRSYGKDGLWLKVQPLCEKVYRQVILPPPPSLVTPPPLPSPPSLRFWSARLHQVTGTLSGGAAPSSGTTLWRCCTRSAAPSCVPCFLLSPSHPCAQHFFLLPVGCCSKVAYNTHTIASLPPIQARMATGQGSGGLDDSICEDDI